MCFNLIYWTLICGKYFLDCLILEKCGKIWKNGRFFWAATDGLGKYCTGGYSRIQIIFIKRLKVYLNMFLDPRSILKSLARKE